jgi:hypothetical protein
LLLTVTEQEADSDFSTEVAVIVLLPGFTAVIKPLTTLAIDVSELVQVTALLVAFNGKIILDNVVVSPGFRVREDLDNEIPFTVRSNSFLQPNAIVIANNAKINCFFMFVYILNLKPN